MPNPLNLSDAPHLIKKDIQKINLKNMPHKETRKFISDTGTLLVKGAKNVGSKLLSRIKGEGMETKWQTPEGKKLMEDLKTKGFWKTLKESKNK